MAKAKESHDQTRDKQGCCGEGNKNANACAAGGGAVYGLGFIGAVVYFIQTADSFWMGVLGILKALVWPALLIYKVLELLKF